ncbi:MAG: hypothetical protein JWO06_1363 [Bacteroidota bacterium]|nr:hypothetical protein [Bacteroidota bacterium]
MIKGYIKILFFAILIFTRGALSAQLLLSKDSVDFGSFTLDSIPDEAVTFKVTNISKSPDSLKIQIYLDSYTFKMDLPPDKITEHQYNSYYLSLAKGESINIRFSINRLQFIKAQYWAPRKTDFTLSWNLAKPNGSITVPITYKLLPKIYWDHEELNLGACKQGDSPVLTYHFKNLTKEILQWKPKASPDFKILNCPDSILPNQQGEVQLRMNTTLLADSINELCLTILTNDDKDAFYRLKYKIIVTNVKKYAAAKFKSDKLYREIERYGDGKFVFEFENTGTIPLIISNCRSSCGCLTPICPHEPILPGKTGVIIGQYDTSRVGRFTKTLTLNSNDRYMPNRVLTVSGIVGEQ